MEAEIFKSDIELIREIIGEDAYNRLHREFAGTSIYIPKFSNVDYAPVFADFELGLSFRQIARKHNYTVVWVQKLYNRFLRERFPRKQEKQLELF